MGEKVMREINILKLFMHPHIIRLYEATLTEHPPILLLSLSSTSLVTPLNAVFCTR